MIRWQPTTISPSGGIDGAWSKAELVWKEVQRIDLVDGMHEGGLSSTKPFNISDGRPQLADDFGGRSIDFGARVSRPRCD
jgi:hypothetical protein